MSSDYFPTIFLESAKLLHNEEDSMLDEAVGPKDPFPDISEISLVQSAQLTEDTRTYLEHKTRVRHWRRCSSINGINGININRPAPAVSGSQHAWIEIFEKSFKCTQLCSNLSGGETLIYQHLKNARILLNTQLNQIHCKTLIKVKLAEECWIRSAAVVQQMPSG